MNIHALQMMRAERRVRAALEGGVWRTEIAIKALQSRLELTLREMRTLPRGVRAGVRAGTKTYRRLGRR
jgi:hypothetical protein